MHTPSVLIATMAEQTDKVLQTFRNLNEFTTLVVFILIIFIGSIVLEPWFALAVCIIFPVVMFF
jgi:hypothetical protein